MTTRLFVFAKFEKSSFEQQTLEVISEICICQQGKRDKVASIESVAKSPKFELLPFTLTCVGRGSGVCVALTGAGAAYNIQSIQYQAFVCVFDLLLTTAPPDMCGGEPAPPPLNTFSPHK